MIQELIAFPESSLRRAAEQIETFQWHRWRMWLVRADLLTGERAEAGLV